MGKILLYEELERQALNLDSENLVLFGERDFIVDREVTYNLIFHGKSDVVPTTDKQATSLVIPVLDYFGEKEAVLSQLALLKELRPDVSMAATSNGKYLEFYDLNPEFGGIHLGKYKTVPEKEFMAHIHDNKKLGREIMEKKHLIDRIYHAAIS